MGVNARGDLNMLVRWIRKPTLQIHDFDWEVSLIVPTPGGWRSVSVSASQARGYHHMWFSGMLGILRCFEQVHVCILHALA